ncbi:MAG: 2-C-methyl-D-erythritol 2,4-cyclodiphosphate synthase [Clostridiales bacterium]|nr:2-C-methyl-D-erythritol 2,4-cyclodiphosphate synthase [Clostridiales bacterium]
MRIGNGFDVHRLVPGRRLILGGVNIDHHLGLLGHSDADVLIHAVMDALLGAAALGDIGSHFPDSNPAYSTISSLLLLAQVREKLAWLGFSIVNIDSIIIAQAPKMAPHIPAMRGNISRVLNLETEKISIKATTTEGLGFTGEGLGIAAQAVVLLE